MNRKRVLVSVDGSNLYHSALNTGYIDYSAILAFGRSLGDVVQARFYATATPKGDREKAFLFALERQGYTHIIARRPHRRPDGSVKSDIDACFVMDAFEQGLKGEIDGCLLVTGDSDVIPLVERLKSMGIEVVVVGPDGGTSWELMRAANRFCPASQVLGVGALPGATRGYVAA